MIIRPLASQPKDFFVFLDALFKLRECLNCSSPLSPFLCAQWDTLEKQQVFCSVRTISYLQSKLRT
ncbi:hypothetical protein FKY79_10730 [Enterococcus faecalis]|nr:hypothetical protein FKZ12_09920 [Enterococcus faecalis]TQA73815.1 hypothetical protein FKY84_09955 [Enterococcus faecalis]TQA80164.1 hypothetical protein FKY79_10730 [Enterococcus faecalis]TQA94915.1 hypothetical protein FKY91_09290 [Enterococcus faecalis]TQB03045.1 hypothetical protein FKY92_05690 [Enterococcus faecalis]